MYLNGLTFLHRKRRGKELINQFGLLLARAMAARGRRDGPEFEGLTVDRLL